MKTSLKIFLSLIFILGAAPELFAKIESVNTVGVPLDGGLLTILAGAGIAYFAARKNKRKDSEA